MNPGIGTGLLALHGNGWASSPHPFVGRSDKTQNLTRNPEPPHTSTLDLKEKRKLCVASGALLEGLGTSPFEPC